MWRYYELRQFPYFCRHVLYLIQYKSFHLDFRFLTLIHRARETLFLWCTGGKYHRAVRKLSRVASLSIHSKYKFTQLTQFERTSREASRSYLLPVHGSTAVQLHRRRIVHQSSDQVCVPRHNIVVLSHHFDPPPPSRFFLFQSRVRESFGIYYGKPVQFSLSSLFLASSPLHPRQTTSLFFPRLTSTSPSSPVLIPPLAP